MAEIEAKVAECVIKACARTPSVRHCVLTSSLLACTWRDGNLHDLSDTINHNSWSDESLCIEKKLWYACGKLKAEKTAWKIAKEEGLKLTTVCPGLITGPEFIHRNPTATIAYLKGAKEMFADGTLATVDIFSLAEAHAQVYDAMNDYAFGRYICYDNIVETDYEAEKLAQLLDLPSNKITGDSTLRRFELSNRKLTSLMSRTIRPCYNES
ncbi:hypothetical protein ACFE04_009471 [Oxalis oulophora]